MQELLLAWFSRNGRDLPWRTTNDPYAILVSEVMAQQTQVDRVVPRWERWLVRWPTVDSLAAASAADVIREWQGLGYNRRALSLHRAAQQVAAHGWPDDLTELPGVGRYTADAVACFAFGRDVLPVDVNVRRVPERTGADVRAGGRAGADGSRRDGLPRARAALRRLPARGGVPVARPALRAAAEAGPVRGLVPAAPLDDAPRSSPRPRGRSRSSTPRPSTSLARDGLVQVAGETVSSRLARYHQPNARRDRLRLLIPLWILLCHPRSCVGMLACSAGSRRRQATSARSSR